MTAQAQPRPRVDPVATLDFLESLYAGADESLFLNVFTIPGEKSRWFPTGQLKAAAEYAGLQAGRSHVYYGVGLHGAAPTKGRGDAAGVGALPGLWFDLDIQGGGHSKQQLPGSIKDASAFLMEFPLRPSLVVHSGGGLQVYWLFREPWELDSPEERARAEQLSKGLQNYLRSLGQQRGWKFDQTGDLARVLRLPGTFNHKTRPAPLVRILRDVPENRYNPDDFEPFVADAPSEPSAPRSGGKLPPEKVREIRSALSFIDPDEYETWVHTGMSLHDATGGSGQGFGIWNEWSQRSDKYDPRTTQAKWDTFTHGGGRTIASLFSEALSNGWTAPNGNKGQSEAPSQPDEARPTADLILDPKDPFPGATRFVGDQFTRDGVRCLHHQRGLFYLYTGAYYAELEESTVRAQLWTHAQQAQQWVEGKDGKPFLVPFRPTSTKINNLFDATRAITHLPAEYAAPCWLNGRSDDPPPAELVPLRNGLLHVPTRQLYSASPRFYVHHALDFAYTDNPPPPEEWLAFLGTLWPTDAESIRTLQEIFGYLLLTDTRQQKIFLVVGPPRSGKGTIARVLVALLGQRNVASPTLEALSTNFGLQPLIGKLLALISDARLGGRNDQAAIAERLLSISGEDSVTIDRKHQEPWTGRLATRFMIMTNELPQLADASNALARRFIVLSLSESFYGREDPLLMSRLLPEIPSIFAWAIEGWERLMERGYFVQPEGGSELVRELEELGSPISAFVRERCTVDVGRAVEVKRLYDAWKHWCESEGREHPGNAQTFGRKLRAAVPGLRSTQPRDGGERVRYYEGIGLNGSWGQQ